MCGFGNIGFFIYTLIILLDDFLHYNIKWIRFCSLLSAIWKIEQNRRAWSKMNCWNQLFVASCKNELLKFNWYNRNNDGPKTSLYSHQYKSSLWRQWHARWRGLIWIDRGWTFHPMIVSSFATRIDQSNRWHLGHFHKW